MGQMPTPRNLLNLNAVEKGYGSRSVLRDVTLGVSAGERIGLVGANGSGKSTLLWLLAGVGEPGAAVRHRTGAQGTGKSPLLGLTAGVEEPDAGVLIRTADLELALLGQRDELDEKRTIRETLIGGGAQHEWAGGSGSGSA